jgi:hypothetical protein
MELGDGDIYVEVRTQRLYNPLDRRRTLSLAPAWQRALLGARTVTISPAGRIGERERCASNFIAAFPLIGEA